MDTVEKTESLDNINDILNDKVDTGNEPEKDEQSALVLPDTYQINSGEALSCDKFYTIAAKESTKMLLLIGPAASGKTISRETCGKLLFCGIKKFAGI
jgi:predicted ATPase with chaperone activity